jgi:uncharacterized protein (TIGR03067 family)
MNVCIAMLTAVSFLAAVDVPKNSVLKKADSLQGTWKLTAGEMNGKEMTAEELKASKLVINDNQFTVTLPGKGTVTGTEKLNSTKSPKTIDIVDSSGPNTGKKCLGIYELKGDVFRVAFAAPGKTRPTTFTSTPNGEQWVHVWTRVKTQ